MLIIELIIIIIISRLNKIKFTLSLKQTQKHRKYYNLRCFCVLQFYINSKTITNNKVVRFTNEFGARGGT